MYVVGGHGGVITRSCSVLPAVQQQQGRRGAQPGGRCRPRVRGVRRHGQPGPGLRPRRPRGGRDRPPGGRRVPPGAQEDVQEGRHHQAEGWGLNPVTNTGPDPPTVTD